MNTISTDQLRQEVLQYNVQHVLVNFPLRHVRDARFEMTSPWTGTHQFGMSRYGYNYLMYRLQGFIDTKYARQLYAPNDSNATNYLQWVTYVNQCYQEMCAAKSKEREREGYIAITVDGELYGLLTNYRIVHHAEVLQLVDEAGLAVTDAVVRPYRMALYVAFDSWEHGKIALLIENGETGSVSLNYQLAVMLPNYTFSAPITAVRRHLSLVDLGVGAIQNALAACQDAAMDVLLKNTPTSHFKLASDHETLDDAIFNFANQPVVKFVDYVARHRTQHGLKQRTQMLLDQVFSQLMERIKHGGY